MQAADTMLIHAGVDLEGRAPPVDGAAVEELLVAAERAVAAAHPDDPDAWKFLDDGARLVACALVWRARAGSELLNEKSRFWGDDDNLRLAFIEAARARRIP